MVELSLQQSGSKARYRPGFWLAIVLGLASFGIGVSAIATSANLIKPRFSDAARDIVLPPGDTAPSTQAGALPGFQRRGATLVGEFRTRDGQTIRLVLDARTQAVIGIRVIGQPAPLAEAPR
jgi:hypothetical protein